MMWLYNSITVTGTIFSAMSTFIFDNLSTVPDYTNIFLLK